MLALPAVVAQCPRHNYLVQVWLTVSLCWHVNPVVAADVVVVVSMLFCCCCCCSCCGDIVLFIVALVIFVVVVSVVWTKEQMTKANKQATNELSTWNTENKRRKMFNERTSASLCHCTRAHTHTHTHTNKHKHTRARARARHECTHNKIVRSTQSWMWKHF